MKSEKIEQGQIWEVLTEKFFVNSTKETFENRKVILGKGEKIEIRYPFAWHFRTIDNIYFQADEDVILKNCKLVGNIWQNVKFKNLARLEDILNLGLYDNIN